MKNLITVLAIITMSISSLFAGKIDNSFFDRVDALLTAHVKDGLVDYKQLQNNENLASLIEEISNADLSGLDQRTIEAFYINAYNLHVINLAAAAYPLSSVQSVKGFFNGKKVTVAGERTTLTDLEKKKLLAPYKDGRLHFVLVCGALGCPPITDTAYRPENLEAQLDKQTILSLNDDSFIKVNSNRVNLSQIFKWYPSDFGSNKSGTIDFINQYRDTPISKSSKIGYYPYDWSINDSSAPQGVGAAAGGNNAARYVVSSTIQKGSAEIKIFNNLFTQATGSPGNLTDRATFLTTSLTALYGLTDRFNIGISTRYRRVQNAPASTSRFEVFSPSSETSSRNGITAFGPQIRWAPIPKWSNFSVQSSYVFAIGDDLTGNAEQPFIDWDGATWWTQVFNDFAIGRNFSLFTELDFLLEDIGFNNRFSTPVTGIISYNPSRKSTFYVLGGYSPFWQADFDYFAQVGIGTKYQITPKFELEVLVTDFTNEFLAATGGQASTLNFGIRFNL